MRKLLLMVAVLAMAAAVVVPASAQISLGSLSGGSTKIPTPTLTNANVSQMLPKYNLSNINQGVLAGQNNPRQFNFAKMLPNFSFINNRWPPRTGQSQVPPQYLKAMQNKK